MSAFQAERQEFESPISLWVIGAAVVQLLYTQTVIVSNPILPIINKSKR